MMKSFMFPKETEAVVKSFLILSYIYDLNFAFVFPTSERLQQSVLDFFWF